MSRAVFLTLAKRVGVVFVTGGLSAVGASQFEGPYGALVPAIVSVIALFVTLPKAPAPTPAEPDTRPDLPRHLNGGPLFVTLPKAPAEPDTRSDLPRHLNGGPRG